MYVQVNLDHLHCPLQDLRQEGPAVPVTVCPGGHLDIKTSDSSNLRAVAEQRRLGVNRHSRRKSPSAETLFDPISEQDSVSLQLFRLNQRWWQSLCQSGRIKVDEGA
jgi:hypothetical protein